jgi:hypothetical protein
MRLSLFNRPSKGPLRWIIDLNVNIVLSDETGLTAKLAGLKQQLDSSTDELQSAAEAAQPSNQET